MLREIIRACRTLRSRSCAVRQTTSLLAASPNGPLSVSIADDVTLHGGVMWGFAQRLALGFKSMWPPIVG